MTLEKSEEIDANLISIDFRDSKRNSSPWSQFTFELRDAAPNAAAPEVPHDAPQHLKADVLVDPLR
jgi:hypothetical protein